MPGLSTRSRCSGSTAASTWAAGTRRQHNFHLYTIVIGAQTLHATGYAMGVQRDGALGTGDPGRDTAVIAYFGDGATAQGDVNEAFVFASVYQRPGRVLLPEQPVGDLGAERAPDPHPAVTSAPAGFGFPGIRVDGNDVLAVHAVTTAALDRARSGEGPTLIEAFTYRMGAHTTSDDPTRYRIAAEVEEWKLKDPIARLKAYLARDRAAPTRTSSTASRPRPTSWPRRSATDCLALPDPHPLTMFDHVYPEPHPLLSRGAGLVRRVPRLLRRGVPSERAAGQPARRRP